uniref:Serine carboxypeptidase 1 n=1 Tax=Ovis aries TaxID=9940 RepID=A0AC11EN79_SHEEP
MELASRRCPVPLLLLLLLLLLGLSTGAVISQPKENSNEVWGYLTVRKDAHMFWWLYYAASSYKNFTELPLIMWLQLQSASLLFVDNPVGAGFSYVDKADAYAKDLATVTSDMMFLLKVFFDDHKEFQSVPFYIFSESYGGKMAAGIALELQKAIQQGAIQCNFAGVALGDAWISPINSVLSWGPFLYSVSLLDDQGLAEVSQAAEEVLDALNKGLYQKATRLWEKTEMVIQQNTDEVNFYNILTKNSSMSAVASRLGFTQIHLVHLFQRHVRRLQQDPLSQLMNGPIRKKLRIIPDVCTWGGQASFVFLNMEGDFMKPVVSIVDELLEAGVNVTVYNGQLDLIVDTMGQESWMRELKWKELPKFNQLKWKPLHSDPKSSETSAFVKSYKNLAFYWILRAGHMVPSDQPETALKMMRLVTHQE